MLRQSVSSRGRAIARWCVRRALPGARTWLASRPIVRRTNQWLNTPCTSPKYLGHPRWHLLSPRFHQWVLMNPWDKPNENVSAHWRAMPARQKDIGSLLMKHRRSLALSPGYEQMARYIAEHSLYPVLDIGCGDGVFLRYLHEEFDVPLEALWGVELDPKRMLAARRQVYIGAVNQAVRREHAGSTPDFDDLDALTGISRRILAYDVMGETPWPRAVVDGGIKAATMLGVAPTMNDRELAGLAECIAKLGPEFVLTSDLYVNIKENYGGRLGLEPFFNRFGYRQVDAEWVPERFSGRCLPYFILQRPYWKSAYFSALRTVLPAMPVATGR